MNPLLWILFTLVIPLLLIEGFFSGAEIALLSADKLTLKRQAKNGFQGAKMALELISQPERVLSTTLLMTNLCVVVISCLITLFFLEKYPSDGSLFAVLITSPLVVLLGELLPKIVYQRHSSRIAPWVAYPVYWTYWLFFPLTRILSYYTNRLSRLIGPIEEFLTGKQKTTREELQSLLSYTKKESEIKASEKKIIKRIFNFKNTEAKHALIPLVQVEAVEEATTVKEALEKFERHRHSRMPVYSGRVDNIIGVLEAWDLFSAADLQQSIHHYISPAHYASETQSLEDLLLEIRRTSTEMVVVVDEHGGSIGILTFEDIVEEIVGDIQDEYDLDTKPFKELSLTKWVILARIEIQKINEQLKFELPQGDYETLSGFLLQQFGRIPEPQDELFFHTPAGLFKFTIKWATERHIESVIIEKLSEEKTSKK